MKDDASYNGKLKLKHWTKLKPCIFGKKEFLVKICFSILNSNVCNSNLSNYVNYCSRTSHLINQPI